MKLKYGKEEVSLPIQGKNIIKILNLKKQKALLNPESRLKNLLKNPRSGEPEKSPEDFNRGQRYHQADTLRSHFTFPIR